MAYQAVFVSVLPFSEIVHGIKQIILIDYYTNHIKDKSVLGHKVFSGISGKDCNIIKILGVSPLQPLKTGVE